MLSAVDSTWSWYFPPASSGLRIAFALQRKLSPAPTPINNLALLIQAGSESVRGIQRKSTGAKLAVSLITGSLALPSDVGVVNRPRLKSLKDDSSDGKVCQSPDISKTLPASTYYVCIVLNNLIHTRKEGFKNFLHSLGLQTAVYTDSDSDVQVSVQL